MNIPMKTRIRKAKMISSKFKQKYEKKNKAKVPFPLDPLYHLNSGLRMWSDNDSETLIR